MHIVILAAGQGKRMRSALPKVLQPLGDRPLLRHVVETAQALAPERIHVVYGHGGDIVQERLSDLDVAWVRQAEQLGTGHAVAQAMAGIPAEAQVLVLYGDVPLVRPNTLSHLVAAAGHDALALLTVVLANPTGYGRIVRDDDNRVTRIVEERDATREERHIAETNTGLLCAQAHHLHDWLARLTNANVQGEYYLTDCIGLAAYDGVAIAAGQAASESETQGINNKLDLSRAERLFQRRQAEALMASGLTLRDPARFDLRGTLAVGQDVEIDVDVVIEGRVVIGDNVRVGSCCVLRDCEIDSDTRIESHTVIDSAHIGEHCAIGPFARLRPGTRLADRAKVGNFVETKNVEVGAGSKINHLSYVGDTRMGQDVNIGAGVITCNYDGAAKHRTTIGDQAFIGSDVQLVAPVTVGANATVGAGTTVTRDAPADTLTVGRARQTTVEGWRRPTKNARAE
ncbi:UDP-N-acetylglucosamine diphosphorylase/glucosamine-1-phosphate N-acetyltransferase [Salinisphaera sp. Q1T1-3]|nr:UDP-N-acetylglucosamine diphosphorylase/glucosamine-1-phosphate N-acetyltransferase [Salinisphaera sp. Q1T1-3]